MSLPIATFSVQELAALCDTLAAGDAGLADILHKYGYPPFWGRPNTFETVVRIILEQQVSLLSAKAAFDKLRERAGTLTPEHILQIADHEFTGLYVSRQKKTYIQELAAAVLSGRLDLTSLESLADSDVVQRLTANKGIGMWTADIYLIMVLHRLDRFPLGDVAAVSALKDLKGLSKHTAASELEAVVQAWRPYRSIAAFLLWHAYLSLRGRSY